MSGGLASLRPQTARETCWTAQASVVPPWGPKQNFLAVERQGVFLPWLGSGGGPEAMWESEQLSKRSAAGCLPASSVQSAQLESAD